jgi:type II secretory pathway component PulK
MKINISQPGRRQEKGVAILIVMIFLVVMAALISLNSQILSQFKQEVQLNERRQEQKWKLQSGLNLGVQNNPSEQADVTVEVVPITAPDEE